jgi:membrane protein implicated in regulation of membrane protease activity
MIEINNLFLRKILTRNIMIDYFAANLWQFWAVVSVICLIIELSTGGFFIICFAFGAALSAIFALFGLGIYWQLFIFALCSLMCIFLVRPFALKYLHNRKGPERVSNADALLGRIGTVSQDIEAGGFGRVAIDGDDWKAMSDNGEAINSGSRVKVTDRESIIITVCKV